MSENSPPKFPNDFPAEAISLRRDIGNEERLSTEEPDAVLTTEALHLYGLSDSITGYRRFSLEEIATVKARSEAKGGPVKLIVAMLALLGLLALIWLVPLPRLWRLLLGAATVLASLLVLYLRRETDRVVCRLEVWLLLGERIRLELPEKIAGRLVNRFADEVIKRLGD